MVVSFSVPMSPTDIRTRIEAAAAKFTEEVVAAFAESFSAVASELSSTKPVARPKKAAPAPKPAARKPVAAPVAKPAPKKAAPAKRAKVSEKTLLAPTGRRSPEELSKTADLIVGLLASHKKDGMRIEQIKKQLGTKTSVLTRPIQKLLAEGKIKKVGEKRATTYFPG